MASSEPRPPRRAERSGAVTVSHPDLEWRETVQGAKPGDRFVRVATHKGFTRVRRGHLVPRPGTGGPTTPLGRVLLRVKRFILGRPFATAEEPHERLNVFKGLPVFASDNISSSAYATEEIMRVLVLAGAGALVLTMPITIVIVVVLGIVVTSYQQTIHAYPSGGGSYIVASDNLGPLAGLTAAGALLTDYVLTVSVSIAAGVEALTSIFPDLFDYRVAAGLAFVLLLTLGNLRGIRESGTIFSAPTYIYLVAIYGLLAYGLFRFATGTLPAYQPPPEWVQAEQSGAEALGIFLILRAFSSGSVALTGTEAVSNGVPAFKPPESRNARIVLILMGSCFGSIFLAMSFLAGQLGIVPDPTEQETVISQMTRTLVGGGTPYHYVVQLSTALLLVLAANTAFADFPRLASILARDPGVYRRAPGHASERHDHRRATGVRAVELVGAPAPQPDRPATQGGAAVPPGRGGDQRAVPYGGEACRMRSSNPPPRRSPFVAAAMVARDAELAVRVVVPRGPERLLEAEEAAERAGVDVAIERTTNAATVHFVARHQDRRVAASALHVLRRRASLAEPPRPPAPRRVDLVAFRRASDALALSQAEDAEAELIWGRLLQAQTRAHLCGGIPTLIVNDVGGLVGLLRRRARNRGVALRVNPDACACG
jgi:Amino acid permease